MWTLYMGTPPPSMTTPNIRIRNFTNNFFLTYIVYKNTSITNDLASRGLDFGLSRSFIFCPKKTVALQGVFCTLRPCVIMCDHVTLLIPLFLTALLTIVKVF